MKVILGSQSPRRRDILTARGAEFTVIAANTDERCKITNPIDFVREVSKRKAQAISNLCDKSDLVITADTVVAVDNEILGKPCDIDDCRRMINKISGRTHEVITGVTMCCNDRTVFDCEVTKVTFRKMTHSEIESYISTSEPYDKAGGYAVQGNARQYITSVDGNYNNVVGLPDDLVEKMCIDLIGKSIFKN